MTVQYNDPFGPPWKLPALRLILQWNGGILQYLGMEMFVAVSAAVLFMALWLNRFLAYDNLAVFLDRNVILIYALDYITQRFQAALGMMLGFYTTIMYNRWWRVRNVENDVMSGIKSCTIYVSSYVNSKSDEGHAATGLTRDELVFSLVRWVNLAHAIAIGQFYEKKNNTFQHLESLVEMGLMTERELESIRQFPAKYDLPFRWFIDLLDKIVRSDNFNLPVPPALAMINTSVTRTRSALDNLHMYRTVPVPLAYRQLVNITVRFYVIVLILNEGLSALSISSEAGNSSYALSVFWMTLPFMFEYFLFVVSIAALFTARISNLNLFPLFHDSCKGWMTLADALANPFRHWSDEFDWEDYVTRTYIASFSLIENPVTSASKGGPIASQELKDSEKSLGEKRKATIQKWRSELKDPERDAPSCMMRVFGFDKFSQAKSD